MLHSKRYIFLIVILLIPCVFAAPIKSASFTNDGLIILSPVYDFKKLNTDFTYNVHVSNQSNGIQLTNAHTVCVLEIYNSTGSHLLSTNMTWIPADLEWETTIDKGNFTYTGFYSRVIECNYTHGNFYLGDTSEFTFEVTTNGESNKNFEIPMVLIIGFLMLLFLGLYYVIDNEHIFLKILFLFFPLILGIIGISLASYMTSSSINNINNLAFYSMIGLTGLVFIYMVIFFIKQGTEKTESDEE